MPTRIGLFTGFAALLLVAAIPAVSADAVDDTRDKVQDKLTGTCDDIGCLPGSNGPW